jgi:hypothetical protein
VTDDQTPRIRVEIADQKPPGWWRKCVAVINSPAFLTFAAFLLTGVLGAYISGMISDNQHRADQLAAEFKDRQARWDTQEATIDDSMNDRLADAQLVDSAMASNDSSDDIAQRWTRYLDSFRSYEINNVQNSSALRVFAGSSMDDGRILDDDRANAFTWYKDVITAQFLLLDGCLTRAHKAYLARAAVKKAKPAKADDPLSILSNCDKVQTDPTQRKFSAAARKLSDCIASYNTELNGVMRVKREIVEERIVAETNPRRYFPWSDVTTEVHSAKAGACANYTFSEAQLKAACLESPEKIRDPNRVGALKLQCATEIGLVSAGK